MPAQLMLGDDPVDVQSLGLFYKSMPARLLDNNLNINALRTNTLLHKAEWEWLDSRVVEISAQTLNAIGDLRALGLTRNLGGLGVLTAQYEQVSDMSDAEINMAVEVDDEEDRVDFPLMSVPVPIISKSFRIDARSLAASRRFNSGLDATHVDTATRKVAEKLEEMFFIGSSINQGGTTIPGVLTESHVNAVAGGAVWTTATNIYPNVLAMIAALQADNYYGPYRLYLNPAQFISMYALNANTAVPIVDMIQRLPGFGPGSVKVSNFVTNHTGVLVNMTSDVVDLAIGQDIAPVEWDEKGGLVSRFKILCAMVPRIKADAAGRSGIAVLAGI